VERPRIGLGGHHQARARIEDGLTRRRDNVTVNGHSAKVNLPVTVVAADRDSLSSGCVELDGVDAAKDELAIVLPVGCVSGILGVYDAPITHRPDQGRRPVRSA